MRLAGRHLGRTTVRRSAAFSSSPKQRVVVLGTGWAGYPFMRQLDKTKYDCTVISPRSYFLFTPLLPSTTVGTLEFRCIEEPVRTIKGCRYLQAEAQDIDFESKVIKCKEVFGGGVFDMEFDKLIIAAGAVTNTFGVPGVSEDNHVYFLKQLSDARAIRNRLLECFERASSPNMPEAERRKLLTFIVVGGGPTSIEFTSELHDFLKKDCSRWYPDLLTMVTVHLIEASGSIMGSFENSLVQYTTATLAGRKEVKLHLKQSVREVRPQEAELGDGTVLPFGLMVWSTGVRPTPLVDKLDLEKDKGRVVIDKFLRVKGREGSVFAMGDCAAQEDGPLPPLAQVANQQGNYLAKSLNSEYGRGQPTPSAPFKYRHLGSMAQIGDWKAIVDLRAVGMPQLGSAAARRSFAGFIAFLSWRSAYWTKTVSIANKILIPMHWFKAAVFGRSISRF
ncbi:unnamed protein product [Chrysoparadoxa australica]